MTYNEALQLLDVLYSGTSSAEEKELAYLRLKELFSLLLAKE